MSPSGDGWPQVGATKPSTIILNDFHSDHSQAQEILPEFPLFPSLPIEISLAIWKCVLQRHRLISITVIDNDGKNGSPPRSPSQSLYTARNERGNTISGKNYRLSVTTNHRLSPLLRVSRVSRQAALEFYRVHIPGDFDIHGQRECLYLNPEFDFLHLKPEGVPEILVDFVHDAKAYDPLGFGVLNMVIGDDSPYDLELPMSMNL
jgi:hypothetical protein